jgi:methylenetetrahydrofolate dehydrogenase (NADP+)/methenyltetrahydrofolate cyclohydrolase
VGHTIDGKSVAAAVRNEVRERVTRLARRGVTPGLATVLVGDDPASQLYVGNKEKVCREVGMRSFGHRLPARTGQVELLALVSELGRRHDVHGILVQLPLPVALDPRAVLEALPPEKDVDGLHPVNQGRLLAGEPGLRPCTPLGVLRLIDETGMTLKGAHAVVVGRSVLVAATGQAGLVRGSWIRPGAVVIDVGMNRGADGKLCGDVEFAAARERAGHITPVPGGVGPMTVAMLLANTVAAAERTA